jgi:hypothetical protein
MSAPQTRREFLKTTAAAAAATSAAPLFLHAADKAGSKAPVVGEGEHSYEVQHGWGQLPSHIAWGDTHGVCVDKQGLVYVKHRSPRREPMDAIAVFDPEGKFVRSFGKEWHGGGHGIDLREEDGQEFLYLSCIGLKTVAKCDLKGEVVWKKGVPTECGKYDTKNPKYSPTNVAFSPDGGYYIGDGYGSSYIHQYDPKGEWVRTWGGFGDAPGKMKTPHGLWLDDRPGRTPSLAVADRANARLQYFTLDGEHIGFVNEVSFPAHFDIRGDVLLCPDLHARVTLFDKDNKVITHLGYEPEWTKQVLADGLALRRDPKKYRPGRFVHPHDACFDHAGNILVVEWVPQGRVSFLRKVS